MERMRTKRRRRRGRRKDLRSGREKRKGSKAAEGRTGRWFLWFCYGVRGRVFRDMRRACLPWRTGFLGEDYGTGAKVDNLRRLSKRAPVVARSAGPTIYTQEVFTRQTTKSRTQKQRKKETNFLTGRGRVGRT